MKRNPKCALVLTGLMAILASGSAWAQSSPVVGTEPRGSAPPPPSGLKVTCISDPNTTQSSTTCPVLLFNGFTYWAYSYSDNRLGMAVIAFDDAGNQAKRWDLTGARYVWQISTDAATRRVTFTGQASRTISTSWDELYVAPPSQGKWVLGRVENHTDQHLMFAFHVPKFGATTTDSLREMTMAAILINDHGVLGVEPRGSLPGCTNPVWRAEIRFNNQAWDFYYHEGTRLDVSITPDRQFTFTPGPGGQVVPSGEPVTCQIPRVAP
ncbi:hypothetical protein [Corallococcus terminator]|uniref:Uncharacterized protein n=1 Tax=Corallococcus terminator TaxID=2316733 RepID=A0A3A8ICT7_9BACT|nr:hypothetical protein [Corallococcus terminator]RKG80456.1 hypothetical protein D7V88_27445 [Corallococcus terminator]